MHFLETNILNELISSSKNILLNYQDQSELLESIYLSLNDPSKLKSIKKSIADNSICLKVEQFYIDKTKDNSEEFKSYFKGLFSELSLKDQNFVYKFIISEFRPCLSSIKKAVIFNVVDCVIKQMYKFAFDNNYTFNEEHIKEFLLKCLLLKFNSSTCVGRGELYFILFFSNTEKGIKGDIYLPDNNTVYEIKGYGAMFGEKILSGKGKIYEILSKHLDANILTSFNLKSWSLSGTALDKIYLVFKEHKKINQFDNVIECCKELFSIYGNIENNTKAHKLLEIMILSDDFIEELKEFITLSYTTLLSSYIDDGILIVTDIHGGSSASKNNNKGDCILIDRNDALDTSIVNSTYTKSYSYVRIIPPGDSDQGYKPMLKLI